MTIAATSLTRVAFVPETTFGTTPATPSFLTLRRTSGNLRTKKTTVTSEEVQADRNVRDEPMVAQDVEGSYDFEMSNGSFDSLIAAVLQSAWGTTGPPLNTIVNGVSPQSFTFEETENAGGTPAGFSVFGGCALNSMTLTFASRAVVKGSMAIMGQDETLRPNAFTGATYAAPGTDPIMTSASVAALAVQGLSLTAQPKVKSLALTIANNLRIRDKVGSLVSEEFGSGRVDVTGTIQAYFENNELLQAVLNHANGSLALTVGAVANKKYTISLPNILFLDGARQLGGQADDVMMSIPFRALYDATTGGSIKLTRAVA